MQNHDYVKANELIKFHMNLQICINAEDVISTIISV